MPQGRWTLNLNPMGKGDAIEAVDRAAAEPGFPEEHVKMAKQLIDMAPPGWVSVSGYGYRFDTGRVFFTLDVVPVSPPPPRA